MIYTKNQPAADQLIPLYTLEPTAQAGSKKKDQCIFTGIPNILAILNVPFIDTGSSFFIVDLKLTTGIAANTRITHS